MKNIVFSIIAVMMFAGTAMAGWTAEFQVNAVIAGYGNGDVKISAVDVSDFGQSCTTTSSQKKHITFDGQSDDTKALLSLLLAAKISGTGVKCYIDGCAHDNNNRGKFCSLE